MTEPTGGTGSEPIRPENPFGRGPWQPPAPAPPFRPRPVEHGAHVARPGPLEPTVVDGAGPASPRSDTTQQLGPIEPDRAAEAPGPADAPGPAGAPRAAEPPPAARTPWWKRPLPLAALAAVVVLGAVGGWLVSNRGSEPLPAPAASTVTAAPPKPTIEASALPADATAFLKAQPGTVLSYARTSAKADPATKSDALESWLLSFSDGSSAEPIAVRAEQFADAESAKAAIETYLSPAVVKAATPAPTTSGTASASASASGAASAAAGPERGPVLVGGKEVGTYYLVPGKGGTETLVWTNGTALFLADGPTGMVKPFFLAYPL